MESNKFDLEEALKNKPGTITLVVYYIQDMKGDELFTNMQGVLRTDHFFIDFGGAITPQKLRELRRDAVKNNESILLATPVVYNSHLSPEYFPSTSRLMNEVDFLYHLFIDKDQTLKMSVIKARGYELENNKNQKL